MDLAWTLSDLAEDVIRTLRIRGETPEDCADRLLRNLAPICYDKDNYAQHFRKQRRLHPRVHRLKTAGNAD